MANKEVAFKIVVDTSEVGASVKKTTKDVEKLGDTTKKTSEEMKSGFKSSSENAKDLGGKLGGAAGGALSFASGIKTMTRAALAFIATPLGAVIAAIVAVGALLKAFFTSSEEGEQKLRIATAALSAAFNVFIDIISSVGGKLVDLFTKPQETLKDFGESIKSYVIDNFKLILSGATKLGQAMVQLFEGDFDGAVQTAKEGVLELGEGTLKLIPLTAIPIAQAKAYKELGIEILNDVKAAMELEDAMNGVKLAERALGVERAKTLTLISEARLAAEDETKSAQERVDALKRAAELETNLTEKELANAKEKLRIIREQNALSRSNEEALQSEADAEVALAQVQLASLNLNRRLKTEINSLEREIETERIQRGAAQSERLKKEAAELQALADLEFKLANEVAAHEVDIYKQLQDAKIALMEEGEAKELALAKLMLERRLEGIIGANEMERQLRDQLEAIGLIEKQAIIDKYKNEELAKKKVADDKLLKSERDLINARISMAQSLGSVLGSIGSMISQQSKEGVIAAKVLAVAQIAIDTAVAITGAIAQAQSVPYPGNLVAIATGVAAVVAGIASAVTTLNSANIPGGGSAVAPSASSITTSAPSFSPVTTNTTELGNTQAAELAPIQAFVVETAITGSQNNVGQIEGQATFGNPG